MRTAPPIASLALLLVLGATAGIGQEPIFDEPEPEPVRGRVLLPYAFYTPETSVAGGVTSVWYFRGAHTGADDRPSMLSVAATYTARQQLVLYLGPEIYLAGGRYLAGGELLYKDFPDRYWGIGPDAPEAAEEDYTLVTRRAALFLERQHGPWRGRVTGVVESAHLDEVEVGGGLDGMGAPGALDGRAVGFGLGAGYDSREDLFAPGRGLAPRRGDLATPPFTDEGGRSGPGSLAVLEAIELGGLEQWITIRGVDGSNPVLLWLHGGPGGAQMPFAHHLDRELERHFVVVHWDQRGAGKSNRRGFDETTMRLERYLQDARELIEHLQGRLGQERIVLLGHSWGSRLGLELVRASPEHFHAYVGVSQVVDHERATVLLVHEYFEALEAPRKELVVFQHSAHLPFFAETEKFNQQLIRIAAELDGVATTGAGPAGPGGPPPDRGKTP